MNTGKILYIVGAALVGFFLFKQAKASIEKAKARTSNATARLYPWEQDSSNWS